MSTAISNKALLERCREFVVADPTRQGLDAAIKNALISASREIFTLGGFQPLAWARQEYDELFTRAVAEISAITKANPGVITADSLDPDLSSDHGFQTGDIAFIRGIDGMDRLNDRYFLATRASATTLTLTQLDGQNAINTTDYDTYNGGGAVYHAGIKIPASTLEPSTGNYQWKIKRIWKALFDSQPADPIAEEAVKSDTSLNMPGGRPQRWMYWRHSYDDPSSYDHYIRFWPFSNNRYNIQINIEKSFPDLSNWTSATVYPPHPPEVHDFIWHRALANLVSNTEKQRRESPDGRSIMGKVEILYAQKWIAQVAQDELVIRNLSKQMLGEMPTARGWSA